MPRHPPCALHSLSHKHSTKTTKTHNPTTSPIKEAAGHYKTIRQPPTPDQSRAGRCQMLASTIHMSNTPPTNPHPTPPASTRERRHRKTQPQTSCGPDSSGPNSVPKPQDPKTPGPEDPRTRRSSPPHGHHPGSTPPARAVGSTEDGVPRDAGVRR